MNITDNTGMEVVITNIHHTHHIHCPRPPIYVYNMSATPSSAVCIWSTFSKISIAPKVIHLNRPLRCQACCFPCCLQELEVIIVINDSDVIVIVVVFFSFIIYPYLHSSLFSWHCHQHCHDQECNQSHQVSSPPGSVIGTVEQQWSILYPR